MAKTIIHSELVIKYDSGSTHTNYIRCVVEMPATEYADFIALGDLTNAIPAAEDAFAATATNTNAPQ